jgi:hypothetical protein
VSYPRYAGDINDIARAGMVTSAMLYEGNRSVRGRLIGWVIAFVLGSGLLATAPALASHRTHTAAGPSASAAQSLANGLPRELCGLLKKPVSVGVNYIVQALSKGRIKGTLAGTIFSNVGFNPWCKGYYGELLARLRGVRQQYPNLGPRLGTFVFGAGAFAVPSRLYANSSFFTVSWTEYGTTPRDKYYLSYSYNGSQYQLIRGGKSIHLQRGGRVRFAVRIINEFGARSPFVFTPVYYT